MLRGSLKLVRRQDKMSNKYFCWLFSYFRKYRKFCIKNTQIHKVSVNSSSPSTLNNSLKLQVLTLPTTVPVKPLGIPETAADI